MRMKLRDRKNWLVYTFWMLVGRVVLKRRFRSIIIDGWQNLPDRSQPFILVSNHTSRWDGLLAYYLLNRPSNFMVSPNELRGAQGVVLRSMGAFPASARCDLHGHVETQMAKGEPVVIFPEGDVFRDGKTHRFKSGTARFALNCVKAGLDVPVVPIAITYEDDGRIARIAVAPSVRASEYVAATQDGNPAAVHALSQRLFREVCHLRYQLGSNGDAAVLFQNSPSGWFDPGSVA
ncbi:MAG TPA: lysophospholipid acyltransferase family protein [Candidatus Obscuribacterales bacterium]